MGKRNDVRGLKVDTKLCLQHLDYIRHCYDDAQKQSVWKAMIVIARSLCWESVHCWYLVIVRTYIPYTEQTSLVQMSPCSW